MRASWGWSRSWRQQVRSADSASAEAGAATLVANMIAQ